MEKLESANSSIESLLAESSEKEDGGEIHAAIERARQALAEAQQANALSLLPKAQVHLAKLMVRTGHYDEARLLARETLSLETGTQAAADAWNILGVCSAETEDIAGGQEHFHRSADLSRQIGYPEGIARALHNLSSCVYMPRGQFDLALVVMEEAQRIHNSHGQPHWGLAFMQAYIAETTGNRKRARQALDELLPLVKPATRIAGTYYYLWARLALDEGELNKAEEYLQLLIRIASNTGVPDLNIWARLEYSRYHRLKNEPAAALSWAEDGLKFAQRTGFEQLASQGLIEHAQAAWESGSREVALADLKESEVVLNKHGLAYDLARVAFLRASWYFQENRPETEEIFIEAAQAITQGGYAFVLERERDAAFPLVAAHLRSRNLRSRKAAENLMQGLVRVAPPPLRITGLGEFSVWQGRRLIPDQQWQRRKAGELFRFLLMQQNMSAGREEILEALWPEHSTQASVDLLHQATSTLRHLLEPDLPEKFPSRYLLVEGERVALKLPDGSQVDFLDFEIRLPAAIQAGKMEALQSALALYHGDLFLLDRYSDWSVGQRERLSDLYLRGLLALGTAYLNQERYFDAVECSRAILRRDAWNEDAVLLGMQAFLGLRDAPRAISLYRKLEGVLKDELDLTPRLDLRQLVEQLRQEK